MKLINLLLILMIVLLDIATSSIDALQYDHVQKYNNHDDQVVEAYLSNKNLGVDDRFNFFRPITKQTRRLTCKRAPRVCRAKGSPGPNCCKKKCVNLFRDRRNCGKCGKKCKYNQICCNGKCVNPSFNKRHCGGCNNRCSSGGLCAFGLCSYA